MNYYGNLIKLLYIVKCQNGKYMKYIILSMINTYIYINTLGPVNPVIHQMHVASMAV